MSDLLDPDMYIGDTFWILPILDVVAGPRNLDAFRIQHRAPRKPAFLSGFKLLLKIVLDAYLSELRYDNFLGMKHDMTTDRAFFVGLPLDKISPTSEKANLVKNLNTMMQRVCSSDDFDSLKKNIERLRSRFASPLANVFQRNVVVNTEIPTEIEKKKRLELVAIFKLWTHAGAIDRLVPLRTRGFKAALLRKDPRLRKARKRLDHQLLGYKLGLAFLWYSLFGNSVEATLHRVIASRNWEQLSTACNWMMREDLERLEANLGIQFGFSKLFRALGRPNRAAFRHLTLRSSVPQLDINEKIDEVLLWHQIEIIDSASSKIFSGSSTFTSLLHGEVFARRKARVKEKLRIVRFRHLDKPAFYSYGLLMERFGMISDFSGWLIFTEVGGKYTGLGGNEYLRAERALLDYRKHVAVTELDIGIKSLREFFLFKIKQEMPPLGSASPTDLLRFRVDDLERLMTLSRARILEFATKLHFERQFADVKINYENTSVLPHRKEIDILAISKSKRLVVVVECSTNVPLDRIDRFIDEMNEKVEYVKKSQEYGGFDRYEKVFVTSRWSILGIGTQRMNQILRKFKRAGIKVIRVEDDIIPTLPKRARKEELLAIFSSKRSNEPAFYD